MDRRNFLFDCFQGCMVVSGVTACSKNLEVVSTDETIEFDLTNEIKFPGNFVRKRGILLIRLTTGNLPENFVAMEGICPHAGGELEWSVMENKVVCPVHGSRFTQQGNLMNGPASRSLRLFGISVSGNILEVRIN